ncbi:unnamed protein product [Paramecium sonneborni]|uniref:Transmembrane protein n=1 Tax=Paramecium sonneborni TaxID=65129 RepID=A0A8S1RQ30_9CILI|nr:unnamed protein product [Paramecium sonneborni]
MQYLWQLYKLLLSSVSEIQWSLLFDYDNQTPYSQYLNQEYINDATYPEYYGQYTLISHSGTNFLKGSDIHYVILTQIQIQLGISIIHIIEKLQFLEDLLYGLKLNSKEFTIFNLHILVSLLHFIYFLDHHSLQMVDLYLILKIIQLFLHQVLVIMVLIQMVQNTLKYMTESIILQIHQQSLWIAMVQIMNQLRLIVDSIIIILLFTIASLIVSHVQINIHVIHETLMILTLFNFLKHNVQAINIMINTQSDVQIVHHLVKHVHQKQIVKHANQHILHLNQDVYVQSNNTNIPINVLIVQQNVINVQARLFAQNVYIVIIDNYQMEIIKITTFLIQLAALVKLNLDSKLFNFQANSFFCDR